MKSPFQDAVSNVDTTKKRGDEEEDQKKHKRRADVLWGTLEYKHFSIIQLYKNSRNPPSVDFGCAGMAGI